MAVAFSELPEPQRSALALFYTDLFPYAEIASMLKLSVEELADVLGKARLALAQRWKSWEAGEPA